MIGRRIRRVLLPLALVGASSCASTSEGTLRELPVGLHTLGALLDGCAQEPSDDGVMRMRCGEDLALSTRERTAGTGEPLYRAEAYGMAQLVGARLVWDQATVATEGPSGLVDRARALEPGTDAVKGTLIGVVRSVSANDVQEVWCSAAAAASIVRCEELVGAVLGSSAQEAAAAEAAAATSANESAPTTPTTTPVTSSQAAPTPASVAPPPPRHGGPVTVFGRALSLPTSCAAKLVADGGDASCPDGTSLSWRRYDEMSEATQAVEATLDALGANGDPEPYGCAIAGEVAQCAAHEHAVAGITYLDGKPLAALCLGVHAAPDHSLCRALLLPREPAR